MFRGSAHVTKVALYRDVYRRVAITRPREYATVSILIPRATSKRAAFLHRKRAPSLAHDALMGTYMKFWWPSDEDFSAFSSIVTMGLALMVFLEAQSIRKTEWLFRQNQIWNDINYKIAEFGGDCRICDILEGRPVEPPLTYRESFLLMSFFNVVSNEYNSLKSKLLLKSYALDSFMDTAAVVGANRGWLIPYLQLRGYEKSFIEVLVVLGENHLDRQQTRKAVRDVIERHSSPASWFVRKTFSLIYNGFAFVLRTVKSAVAGISRRVVSIAVGVKIAVGAIMRHLRRISRSRN